MSGPPFLASPLLNAPGLSHGFFSREGGVSSGEFASLNAGPGSSDNTDDVAENRLRCATALGAAPSSLLTAYQVHSADVLAIEAPWKDDPPKVDGLVTATPGLAIGVLAADCMPWLFADPRARIIAAAHGGWRGALAGILENTIEAMERLGAERDNIRAVVGPCLRQPNFEVSLDLVEPFLDKYPNADIFFAAGQSSDKRQLDLAGFGAWRLRESGVSQIDDLDICTLAEPDRYFSYRATIRRRESHYGRNLSAILIR
ncbi:MAG: peptidoglycan editing factor PgeF [Marinicaulis sp.]|nr:peptidoglycan editing factor PgeF [Marinicaulis sp.]